jgi:hypothetical protein
MSTTAAATIMDTARAFFDACDTGKGWDACSAYCHADATFAAQAEPLADVTTVKEYADWMKALLVFVPDGGYEMKAFGLDEERNSSREATSSSPSVRTAQPSGRSSSLCEAVTHRPNELRAASAASTAVTSSR